jgi:hypothetical protein
MPTVEIAKADGNLMNKNELHQTWLGSLAPADTDFRAKALSTEEILYGAFLCTWRTKRGDNLAFIASVNPKIVFVHCDDNMAGKELTHANQTQVS